MSDDPRKTGDNALENDEPEMSFLEHLEELRWRIIRALVGIVVGAIICWVFIDQIMNEVLLQPVLKVNSNLAPGQQPITLQNLKPFGQVFLYMEVALIGGVIIAVPYLLYEIWAFIAPGLLPKERKHVSSIVIFSSFCFLAGIAFAYFIMITTSMILFA